MQKSRDKSVLRHFWKYRRIKVAAYGKPCIKPRDFTEIAERVLCSCSRSLPFPFASHLAFFWRLPKHSYFLSRAFYQRYPRILPLMNTRQTWSICYIQTTINCNFVHVPRIRDYLLSADLYLFFIVLSPSRSKSSSMRQFYFNDFILTRDFKSIRKI